MKRLILSLLLLLCLTQISRAAAFWVDTCTDTDAVNITSHTPETGGAYSYVTGANAIISTNTCLVNNATSSAQQLVVNAATPPSADYYVQAVSRSGANSATTQQAGVVCRRQSGADTYYTWFLIGNPTEGSRAVRLQRVVAGAGTTLAEHFTTWLNSTNYLLRLDCINEGADVRLKGYFEDTGAGNEVVNFLDNSGSQLTTAGVAGFRIRAGTTGGSSVDNITTDEIVAASTRDRTIIP